MLMIGAIVGDIVGSRFEFNNIKSKEFELFTEECFVTDDSIMTIAVAKALMETGKVKDNQEFMDKLSKNAIYFMQKIGRIYPSCGYGGHFGQWIFTKNPEPYDSYGNGAAMRISPVGLIVQNVDELKLLSKAVTEVSHNHEEGIKGAEAIAMAIYLARTGSSKEQIRKCIVEHYYEMDFTLDEIRDSYRFNETCQNTVPQAIQAFLEANSFEDTTRNAISIGGDSDTLAAIAGSIAEAYYGVPDEMKERALSYLDEGLIDIIEGYYRYKKERWEDV